MVADRHRRIGSNPIRDRPAHYVVVVISLRRSGFRLASLTPLRKYLYYRYDFSFSPNQLCFLVSCLNRTACVEGRVVEIGCAYGHTTVFLEKHLTTTDDIREYVLH